MTAVAKAMFAGLWGALAAVCVFEGVKVVRRKRHQDTGSAEGSDYCYCRMCRPDLYGDLPEASDYPEPRDYVRRLRESLQATLARLDQEQAKLDDDHPDCEHTE